MKNKIIMILIVMLLVGITVISVASASDVSNGNIKITICHFPPGNTNNPQTIEIAQSALPAHTGNHIKDTETFLGSDSIGPCSTSQIPEFPTVALPIAAAIGLVFFFQQWKKKEE